MLGDLIIALGRNASSKSGPQNAWSSGYYGPTRYGSKTTSGPVGPTSKNSSIGPAGPMKPVSPASIGPAGPQGPGMEEPSPWLTWDDGGSENGGGGGGGGGYNAAAYVQSLINGIEETYNRQRGQLDTNKANSAGNIQKNFDAFKQGVANNQALYQQGSAAIQAEITRRMAESAARNTELGNQIGTAVAGIGGNAAIPQAQVAANAATLASSQGFQQDLGNRLDQIVAANQRSVENSGDLVRQGASGNLENNYNAMLNALLAQREQSIAEARQAASSGGGGGGGGGRGGGGSSSGGTDYSKAYKQATDKQRLEWMLNDYTPSNTEVINMLLRSGDPSAIGQAAALMAASQNVKNQ